MSECTISVPRYEVRVLAFTYVIIVSTRWCFLHQRWMHCRTVLACVRCLLPSITLYSYNTTKTECMLVPPTHSRGKQYLISARISGCALTLRITWHTCAMSSTRTWRHQEAGKQTDAHWQYSLEEILHLQPGGEVIVIQESLLLSLLQLVVAVQGCLL